VRVPRVQKRLGPAQGGVPIAAGTDQAVPSHSLHRELEPYVKAGITLMEAIMANSWRWVA
jgi:imidazolonepropionase-like amidohydrolase